jgi:hypothetical protein
MERYGEFWDILLDLLKVMWYNEVNGLGNNG